MPRRRFQRDKSAVPSFSSGAEVEDSYRMRRDIRGFDTQIASKEEKAIKMRDLYPRDGFKALTRLEKKLGNIIGVDPGRLLAYPSGMSAVVAAIESAHLTAGSKILLGQDHYTEIARYVDDHLRPRGVEVARVDSGNSKDIHDSIVAHSPDVIFFETVANGTSMPVLDIDDLLSSVSNGKGKMPLIILDNTLSTPTNIPASKFFAGRSTRIIVVESGTKSYAMNSETLGILYTNDKVLWTQLFSSRITVGYTPTPSSIDRISKHLPESSWSFDSRNNRIFKNTLRLAEHCLAAAAENSNLTVVHPNLHNHPNSTLSNSINQSGVTPVFYINNGLNQYELVDKLFENPIIKGYCKISQSFGFDETRIYPYYGNTFVRFAAGTESNKKVEEIGLAIYSVLRKQ